MEGLFVADEITLEHRIVSTDASSMALSTSRNGDVVFKLAFRILRRFVI